MPVSRRPPPLGQHFLTDRRILERIVEALEPSPADVVLEVGAGRGALTRMLAERVGRVVAIETDRRLVAALHDVSASLGATVRVVQGDALRLDWHALLSESSPPSSGPCAFKVAGNIPYRITTPLIEKALTAPLPQLVVFLVQAEVADRMAAGAGSKVYGGLSVGVQSVCRVERLFGVGAGAFQPPPRVQSAVVRLRPLARPLVDPARAGAFRRFVTGCFTRRRKQLRNVLSAVTGRPTTLVTDWLQSLGIEPHRRPETLDPELFARLFAGAGTGADLREEDRL